MAVTSVKQVRRLGNSVAIAIGPEVKQLGLDVGDSIKVTIERAETEPVISVREHEEQMAELSDRLDTFAVILHGALFNGVNDVLCRMTEPMLVTPFAEAVVAGLDRFSQQVQALDPELFWGEFNDILDDMEIQQHLHRVNGRLFKGPAQ